MKTKFNIWWSRNLSIFGRILVTRPCRISSFIYILAMSMSIGNSLETAQSEVTKFIQKNKPSKVKRKTLIGKYEWGGLKSVDVNLMQKSPSLAWIARFWSDQCWSNLC